MSLAWDPSRDKFGVKGYGVYLNGSVVATSSWPGATISGLGCGRAYSFEVDAYDAADNHSRRTWAIVATTACQDQQAPTAPAGFRQQAATQDEVVLAWDPSTDNIGVVAYGIYRNGILQASTAAPTVTLSGLTCGSVYDVAVDAVDAAGNRSQPRSTWVRTAACSDTERPAKPILSLGPATQTTLVLSWQPGVDNVGVAHYNIFLDGAKVAQTTGLTWTYTALACDTDYALGLEVVDAAGNTSVLAEGTVAPVRTSACPPTPPPADTTAPSQPGDLALAAATNTSMTLAWTASTDNVGVAGYGVYLNGASVQTRTQPGATVSGLTCGTAYTLAVDAYDLAGNRSTKASVVGTTAPCADTQAPSAPANVAVTSRTATSIALSWSASSDNVGIVGYGLYRGATLIGTTAVTTGIFSNLSCGSAFTLAVDSYDAAGNRSSRTTITASTTACPDTTPPSAPSGLSTSNVTGTSLTLRWNASTDNVGVTGYDVYRNGAKVASVTGTSSSQTGLACGISYTFAVASYDSAGNRSPQAQLTAPTAACTPPPPPPPPPPAGGVVLQAGQSLNTAYQAAAPGAIILLAPGCWGPGQRILHDPDKVASLAPVVLRAADPTNRPVFGSCDPNAYRGDGLDLSGVTALTLDGVIVNGDLGVVPNGSFLARNVIVTRSKIKTTHVRAVDGLTFRDTEFGNFRYDEPGGPTSSWISNYPGTPPSRNVLIERTTWHNIRQGASSTHAECLILDNADGITIRHSYFLDCPTMSLFMSGDNGNVTRNALIERNMFTCPAPGDTVGCGATINMRPDFQFQNVTFRSNQVGDSRGGLVYLQGSVTGYSNVRMENNKVGSFSACHGSITFVNNRSDPGLRDCDTGDVVPPIGP